MTLIRDGFQSADLDIPVVLPTLNLDFANSQSLDERITFSRGSIGTFMNKNGLIETAAANIPRFDYDPISGECKGLLIEESRQNLLTYSEDFSNAAWTKSQSSIITTSIIAPNGSTAYKLVENTVSGVGHYFTQSSISKTSNAVLTLTIFAKAAERQYLGLVINSASTGFGNRYGAEFNLGNGTVSEHDPAQGTYSSGSYSITPYPNGWYRCRITCTTSTDAQSQVRIFTFRDTNQWTSSSAYAGDGTSGIYVWGAQIEAGSFPTSYIPTSGSTVTRSADNASMTGTNFSSWYNQNEGTFYISGNASYVFQRSFGASIFNNSAFADNRISIRMGNTFIRAGAEQFAVYPQASRDKWKLSFGLKQNDATFALDGSRFATDKNVTLPSNLDTLEFGKVENVSSGLFLNGTISRFTYYPKALSPAQLQYLTQ